MTINSVYSFVSESSIPKKKEGKYVFYSKYHVDKLLKEEVDPERLEYYTVPEAMEKYNMSRDQIYHYVKYHKIPKIKIGKSIKIAKQELDSILNPIII